VLKEVLVGAKSRVLLGCVILLGFVGIPQLPASPILIYNTGVGDLGELLAPGSFDTHYSLIRNPASDGSTAFVVAGIVTDWLPNTGNSQWISPVAYPLLEPAPGKYDGGLFAYIYRTPFYIPSGFSGAFLTGQWAADDTDGGGGELRSQIFLNGLPTGNTAYPGGFSTWSSFFIDNGFRPGENYLDFVAYNLVGATGIQVQINGEVVPEPTTLSLVISGLFCLAIMGGLKWFRSLPQPFRLRSPRHQGG
jgi:hypothetical protein